MHPKNDHPLQAWSFWFAVIAFVISGIVFTMKLDGRMAVIEAKMDLILVVNGINSKERNQANLSDKTLWPWEEWMRKEYARER